MEHFWNEIQKETKEDSKMDSIWTKEEMFYKFKRIIKKWKKDKNEEKQKKNEK